MSIEILRFGDKSDRGPNGEFGAAFVYKAPDTSKKQLFVVHCSEPHTHSRECVIGKLKPLFAQRMREEEEAKAAEAIRNAPVAFTPLPKRTVQIDGKDVEVDDTRVDEAELAVESVNVDSEEKVGE